ncbi:hypothetical protein CBR_g81576 [Chara braunii]|uniref:DUF659 domain-containing protein n=1 Tax=Chara braunii TaxID=69332 RepID=A0A388KAV1_CHABU|nr:hypothetical protein CBR_g81576 [Chara braunii]|eukprot:GBG67151.1 hypothetical protein CBR_g81576 [Chara braunii]
MPRGQARVFEDGGEDENLKAQKRCCVYKYIPVGQSLDERFRGNRMLKCVFCGHEFQGNQFVAARHFRQGKGCPEVTDEALVDIHYNSEYKMSDKFLQRIQQFAELHGPTPTMDPRRDEGGGGEMRDAEEQIDMHGDVKEVARAGSSGRERGKGLVIEPGGQQGQYFASAHVSVRTRAGADTAEAGPSAGKRKEREEGARPTAAPRTQKRLRQNTITESFSAKWQMEFKKKWLQFVYSQRLADLSGPVKVLWPSENEIADIETIVHTADDVGAELAEVRAPFYVTGATIMSDGRKSRDARPIINFLAGGSRGVMLVRTMNREGERDRAPDVLARWIKVFDDFPPKWVNAICTDSASAYVAAANMLQGPQQRPKHRRITWLAHAVHVCNKMLSDIGCSGPWSKDIIVRGRAVVRFIKEHGAALHIFWGESSQMGLIYPCETRFASVFTMVERLLAVRSALERTVDGDTWGMVPWDHSVRQLARWVKWQVRHGSWWDSMGVLFRIMEPVYDLLRRLDRRGLHMSQVVEWTQDLARHVAEEVCALPTDLAHYIVQRVQARCAHMLEPAHAAAHILCPSRRDLRYFEGMVSDYDASLVREAESPAEVHDTTQWEETSAEVSSTGVDVQQGTHESRLAPTEEPRSEPAHPPVVQLRPKETLQEMSPGLEDIQKGQSAGVDDIRPSAQAEGIAPTTGGDVAVAGVVGVGGSGVPSMADPMSTSGGGDPAQVDRHDADGQEMPRTLVVRTAVGSVVPHQAPFLEGYRRRAHGGGLVEERRVGRGACIPPVPTFMPSRTRPEIRHVATPRGSLLFGFMTAEELEDHGRRDLTEIDQRVLSETRRVMTASASRQPGLRGASTVVRCRDVVASGFGGRGGGGGGSVGQGDDIREGAGVAAASAVDPPLTYGLGEASIMLHERDVVTRPRQERHVPLDRRQEGETSGTDGLPMARESRRRDDLAAAGVGRMLRGRRLIMDDDLDEYPVAPEPSAGRRGGQRQRDRLRGSGRRGGGGSHRSKRDPRAQDDR